MKDHKPSFTARLMRAPMILDGAIGTTLNALAMSDSDFRGQSYRYLPLSQAGNFDLLSLSAPEIVRDLHRQYLHSGADIISTNTFMANESGQQKYGTEHLAYDLNLASARLAQSAVKRARAENPNRTCFVAGVIGPGIPRTAITQTSPPDLNSDKLFHAYAPAVSGLIEGGADILLVETVYDLKLTRELLRTIKSINAKSPIWISAVIDTRTGSLPDGSTLKMFANLAGETEATCVGFNCVTPGRNLVSYLESLNSECACPISVHPSAGLPDRHGIYSVPPDQFAGLLKDIVLAGAARIVGGCCGTTPEYIARLRDSLSPIFTHKPDNS